MITVEECVEARADELVILGKELKKVAKNVAGDKEIEWKLDYLCAEITKIVASLT